MCHLAYRISSVQCCGLIVANLTIKHSPVISQHVGNAISQLLVARCWWFGRLMSCCKLHTHRIDQNTQCLNGSNQVDHIIWLAIAYIRKVQSLRQWLTTDLVGMEKSMNPAWQASLSAFYCACYMQSGNGKRRKLGANCRSLSSASRTVHEVMTAAGLAN